MTTMNPGRPIGNTTRVTVAFPFSSIEAHVDDETLAELASLVTAIAAELDHRKHTPASGELVTRSTALASRLGASRDEDAD
jgi:hypothetical protein